MAPVWVDIGTRPDHDPPDSDGGEVRPWLTPGELTAYASRFLFPATIADLIAFARELTELHLLCQAEGISWTDPVEPGPDTPQDGQERPPRAPGGNRVRNRSRRPELILVADADYGAGDDCQSIMALVGSCDAGSGTELVHPRHVSSSDGPGPPKVCTRCKNELPLSMFGWVTAAGRKYKAPHCRSCDAARQRARRRQARRDKPVKAKAPPRETCCHCDGPLDGADRWRCKSCNRARGRELRRRRKERVRLVRDSDSSM